MTANATITALATKARTFRQLHHGPDLLVLPNAWDAASARYLEQAGYPAIATSSAGVAATAGYADGDIPPDEMLSAVARICRVVHVPVSADLEDAYVATGELAAFVADVINAGAVGLNVEDCRRDATELVPLRDQIERVRGIREASNRAGVPLVINARTDVFLRQIGATAEREAVAVERGRAFLAAGADCVFVPGVSDAATIERLVRAIEGPVNVLAVAISPSLGDLRTLGVRRVSLGSGPARLALAALRDLCADLAQSGRLDRLATAISYDEVNHLMRRNGR